MWSVRLIGCHSISVIFCSIYMKFLHHYVQVFVVTDLLHAMHKLGQEEGSLFSSADKAPHPDAADTHHPIFGFKKDLIRLIGNICHEHRVNQDKVNML